MSLREALASNLTRLCEREKSISAVCRGTHINRQQFDRYLSGAALPNQQTRDRICQYFKIDEGELFREIPDAPSRNIGDETFWSHVDAHAILGLLRSQARTSVAPGIYHAHFAIPNDQQSLMRSTIIVRNEGNLSTFRRLTGVSEPAGSWWSYFHGDHKGIILERRHWLYFVALNQKGNLEPTLLIVRWLATSRPMLGGHAAILNPPGPTLTVVVYRPLPAGHAAARRHSQLPCLFGRRPDDRPHGGRCSRSAVSGAGRHDPQLDLHVKPVPEKHGMPL